MIQTPVSGVTMHGASHSGYGACVVERGHMAFCSGSTPTDGSRTSMSHPDDVAKQGWNNQREILAIPIRFNGLIVAR